MPPRPRDELASITRSPSLSVLAALRLFATAPREEPALFFFSATIVTELCVEFVQVVMRRVPERAAKGFEERMNPAVLVRNLIDVAR